MRFLRFTVVFLAVLLSVVLEQVKHLHFHSVDVDTLMVFADPIEKVFESEKVR